MDTITTTQINVQDAKTNLSRYLDAVEKGEVFILCRHNKPVAELRAIPKNTEKVQNPAEASAKVPKFGLWDGFGLSDGFFEPIPEDVLKAAGGQ